MKILITGIAGFAGRTIASEFLKYFSEIEIFGFDNLSRAGSECNLQSLYSIGVKLSRGDVRNASDLDSMPKVEWVIDCAANPSVLAGLDGKVSSRQVMEHNLIGTINLLEYCKRHDAGLILLSTSRVYSADALANLPVKEKEDAFRPKEGYTAQGISAKGITEGFPTSAPISLYGASKLASEALILEYSEAIDFPVWINRCGVLAGAGQFGKADQGIFSYWIHSFREKKSLRYFGFSGSGLQVRDALHPRDLVSLIAEQMKDPKRSSSKVINVGGGIENSMSLKQLSAWCQNRFGPNLVIPSKKERQMDAPWIVIDNALAEEFWDWKHTTTLEQILEEIAQHAENNPQWLNISK